MTKTVLVIGAGPAGLTAVRHLASDSDNFVVTCLERRGDVGGLWNYSEETGTDKYGLPLPTSVYKHLITNSSKEVMGYPDFHFEDDLPSFMPHHVVKDYLDKYAEKFQLRNYIKFNRLVINIQPVDNQCHDSGWSVLSRDILTDETHSHDFDAVLVCTGPQNYEYIPAIPGSESFLGIQLHSKNYRDPDLYTGRNVLVLGGRFSAYEIIYDLVPRANKVYVVRRKSLFNMDRLSGVEVLESVQTVTSDGVILDSGELRKIDVIIYATGYSFAFPFVSPTCGLTVSRGRVTPLHRLMINIKRPSMIFLDLAICIPQFRICDVQARYACAVLSGKCKLPPEAEMLIQEEEEYQRYIVSKGMPEYKAHSRFSFEMFSTYINQLIREADTEPLAVDVMGVIERVYEKVLTDLENIKKLQIKKVDGEYVVINLSSASKFE